MGQQGTQDIQDIIEHWRRLRGERACPGALADSALSATILLAPDGDNVFRVMAAGKRAQRLSGLGFGAAFLSIVAPEHRLQMSRRLAGAAQRHAPSLTRAHRRASPDADLDILLLPLRSGGKASRARPAMVLVGLAPKASADTPCRDLILECSGPLPGFTLPVIRP
jgi:hypothetical protein